MSVMAQLVELSPPRQRFLSLQRPGNKIQGSAEGVLHCQGCGVSDEILNQCPIHPFRSKRRASWHYSTKNRRVYLDNLGQDLSLISIYTDSLGM